MAPTAAELTAALLTPADLPGSFTTQSLSGGGLGDDALSGCPTLTTDPPGVRASVGSLLAGSDGTTFIGDTLQQLAPADVVGAMNRYAALPSACRTFSGKISGQNITLHTASLAFPGFGSRTVAVAVTFSLPGLGTISEDFVIVQYKDTLIGVVSQGLPTDTALTREAVSNAVKKVAARW